MKEQKPRRKPPSKPRNIDRRSREYLTAEEMQQLIRAARSTGRYGDRDATLILMAYIHGLRPGEIVNLTWADVDLEGNTIRVPRLKNGQESIHKLQPDEREALVKLRGEASAECTHIFSSERKSCLKTRAVHTIIARAGRLAGLEFSVHPQMLRHTRGYQLVKDGVDSKTIQAYFGHRRPGSVAAYRFDNTPTDNPTSNNTKS